MVQTLMILSDRGNIQESFYIQYITTFKNHYDMFKSWGEVFVFSPDYDSEGTVLTELNNLKEHVNGDWKGIALKTPIINILPEFQGNERIIFIDDHSGMVNVDLKWKFRDPMEIDDNFLMYIEIDPDLGGNHANYIIRGSGSGEAVTSGIIAHENRRVFCSMHDDEDVSPDTYSLCGAINIEDLLRRHYEEVSRLYPDQHPHFYYGY